MPVDTAPSPAFIEAFRAQADPHGCMSFDRFMALALYDPQLGYYRQARTRVGRAAGTDFYTATSSGAIFGELIAAACVTLLKQTGLSPSTHTFIEIGAEPGSGVLDGVIHPFAATRILRLDDALQLSGPCIVFSNELFDAQPCRRFVFREGTWRELGVQLDATGTLSNIELPAAKPLPSQLPPIAPEGYHMDLPLASIELAQRLAAQPWSGLFIACDYGKSWKELTEATPAGTVRAYHQHRQSNDLLARPGEQDLTCHICWDWLAEALDAHGFGRSRPTTVQSQEAFFIHHAADFLAATMAAEAAHHSPRKRALLQLLHPAHLGQKFQVLHAHREARA